MSCQEDLICDWPSGEILPFDANPDIAGLGVLVAFSITAWISAIVFTAHCFIEDDILQQGLPNSYDRVLRDFFHRLRTKILGRNEGMNKSRNHQSFKASLQTLAMALNDQQLVTGAAISIVGFLQHCTITQYHFLVVYTLSWLSYQNVDATISVIGRTGSSTPMRYWRAIWMLCLCASLAASTLVVADTSFVLRSGQPGQPYFDSDSEQPLAFGANAQCVWNRLGNGNAQYDSFESAMCLFALVPILWSLISAVGTMFEVTTIPVVSAAYKRLLRKFVNLNSDKERTHKLGVQKNVLYIFFPTVILLPEMLESDLLKPVRSWLVVAPMTTLLFRHRELARVNGLVGNEDEFSFGQVLPVFLLSLLLSPIIQLASVKKTVPGRRRAVSLPNISLLSELDSGTKLVVRTSEGESSCQESIPRTLIKRPTILVEEGRGDSSSVTAILPPESKSDDITAFRRLLGRRADFRIEVLFTALLAYCSIPIVTIALALYV